MKQYSSPQRHALLHAVHNCGSPRAVENADSPSGMTTFGSLVTYNCKSGYSPDRDGAAVCTMSGWINVPKCQGTGHIRGLTLNCLVTFSSSYLGKRITDVHWVIIRWRNEELKRHYTRKLYSIMCMGVAPIVTVFCSLL